MKIESYIEKLKKVIGNIDYREIENVSEILFSAIKKGSRIYVMGNGGSASTASHFTVDFMKSLNANVICLNDNIPTITAIANDISYDDIFIEQLFQKNIEHGESVIIAFSGSGNSKNVVKVFEFFRHISNKISITGFDGGRLKELSNFSIHIPVSDMQIAEDFHLIVTHALMRNIREKLNED